jgi:hypothetical protein
VAIDIEFWSQFPESDRLLRWPMSYKEVWSVRSMGLEGGRRKRSSQIRADKLGERYPKRGRNEKETEV